jgi:hypothetical protein
VLEKLGYAPILTRRDYLLFYHLTRVQSWLTQGFQMLADNKLTNEDWKKLRVNAKHRVSELAENALARYVERNAWKP